jgi:nicotinamidase-related amidase
MDLASDMFSTKVQVGGDVMTNGKTALIVVDVQQGLFERSQPIYRAEAMLDTFNALIDEARQASTPVIYIQHENENTLVRGTQEWQLHPRIQPLHPEVVVHKQYGNAFEKTILQEELTERDVSRVVICGLVTHGCVRATCLGALNLGYEVVLVADGHSSFSKDAVKLIKKWNRTLERKGVELVLASELVWRAK